MGTSLFFLLPLARRALVVSLSSGSASLHEGEIICVDERCDAGEIAVEQVANRIEQIGAG
jgi:hypothetical protein